MSIRAIYEIVINFNEFRNVDLRQQGLYRVQIGLYFLSKYKKTRYYAHPLYFDQSEKPGSKKKHKHNVIEPQVMSEYYYCTKGFLIKYLDEVIQLNEIIKFRMENDIFDPISSELYLETNLMMVEISNCREIEKGYITKAQLEALEYKSVYERLFLINYSSNFFIFQFLPIIFNELNYAECDIFFYFRLSDFKLRKNILSNSKTDDNMYIVSLLNQKM